MLPGVHGFDVLKALRAEHHGVPVLVLSARQDAADKVRALELRRRRLPDQAVLAEELVARVRARLRRPVLSEEVGTLVSGPIRIDTVGRHVTVDGAAVDLTRAEFELLSALARRPGAAVSRAWLAEPRARSVARRRRTNARACTCRACDASSERAGRRVETVWGVGYRLEDRA